MLVGSYIGEWQQTGEMDDHYFPYIHTPESFQFLGSDDGLNIDQSSMPHYDADLYHSQSFYIPTATASPMQIAAPHLPSPSGNFGDFMQDSFFASPSFSDSTQAQSLEPFCPGPTSGRITTWPSTHHAPAAQGVTQLAASVPEIRYELEPLDPFEISEAVSTPLSTTGGTPISVGTPLSIGTPSELGRNDWVPEDIYDLGYQDENGQWRCKHNGCGSTQVFDRACDLRKHYRSHQKSFFCNEQDCPWFTLGFSTQKDCRRHKLSHNPNIKCAAEGCERQFSRMDNMRKHYEAIHMRSQNNLFPRRCRKRAARKSDSPDEIRKSSTI